MNPRADGRLGDLQFTRRATKTPRPRNSLKCRQLIVLGLVALLRDTVNGGAAVGFLPPLDEDEATAYWQDVIAALRTPYRLLFVAEEQGAIIGTVQLDLSSRTNGLHRAEVAKMMVHSAHRRRGIARALMQSMEEVARAIGRTTLVLDTREGEPSEALYTSLGYTRAGVIPRYARSADGSLHTTVLFYKLLD
jgi:GNAT superfamily N-acetyltransferase